MEKKTKQNTTPSEPGARTLEGRPVGDGLGVPQIPFELNAGKKKNFKLLFKNVTRRGGCIEQFVFSLSLFIYI